MNLSKILLCISTWIFVSYASFAEDPSRNLEKEENSAREMTKAMQRAQLLLSDVSAIFECDYSGYDVKPRETGNGSTYLVVIDVNKDSCTDMVVALNEQGAEDKLVFVTERRMPQMKPLQSPGDELTPAPLNSPSDYTLINEVDPDIDR